MLKPLKIAVSPDQFWLVGDTHFHHDKPWILGPRSFKTIDEHDETLILRWHERVGPQDTVFHLGDFMMQSDAAGFWAIVRRLPFGTLYLQLGNHNSGFKQAYTTVLRAQHPSLVGHDGSLFGEVYPLATCVDGDPSRRVVFLPEYVEVSVAKHHLVLSHYPLTSWHHMSSSSLHCHGHCHSNLKEKMPFRRDVGIEAYGGPVSLAQILRETQNEKPAIVDHHGQEEAL